MGALVLVRFDASERIEDIASSLNTVLDGRFDTVEEMQANPFVGKDDKIFKLTITIEEVVE